MFSKKAIVTKKEMKKNFFYFDEKHDLMMKSCDGTTEQVIDPLISASPSQYRQFVIKVWPSSDSDPSELLVIWNHHIYCNLFDGSREKS